MINQKIHTLLLNSKNNQRTGLFFLAIQKTWLLTCQSLCLFKFVDMELVNMSLEGRFQGVLQIEIFLSISFFLSLFCRNQGIHFIVFTIMEKMKMGINLRTEKLNALMIIASSSKNIWYFIFFVIVVYTFMKKKAAHFSWLKTQIVTALHDH